MLRTLILDDISVAKFVARLEAIATGLITVILLLSMVWTLEVVCSKSPGVAGRAGGGFRRARWAVSAPVLLAPHSRASPWPGPCPAPPSGQAILRAMESAR